MEEILFLIPISFFVFGAIIGSFLNVIIYRWPKEESVVVPRSKCPQCETPIPFYFNVPVLSWFILKGKTACCKKDLSFFYPFIEALTGALFVFTYYKFGLTFKTLELCLFIALALPCVFIDLKHFLLPDILTFPGMVFGLLGSFFAIDRTPLSSILGLVLGGGSFWFLAWFYERVRKKEGMGFGDVKLIAWLGALCGLTAIPFVVFVSSFLGAIVGVVVIAFYSGNRNTALPFGPFLIFAALMYLYFYDSVVVYLRGYFLFI